MIDARLEEALKAGAALDRRAAAEEIAESGDSAALRLLIAQLGRESSRAVKEAILLGISGMRGAADESAILELLRDEDPFVRAEAAAMLERRMEDSASSADGVAGLLRGGDKDLRKFALEILGAGAVGLPDEFYIEALKDEDVNVAICAVELIGSRRRTTLAGAVLGIALEHSHPMLAYACLETLALIGTLEALEGLREKFPDAATVPWMLLPPFLRLIGRTAGREATEEICRCLAARGPSIHSAGIEALTRITARHRLTEVSPFCEEMLCGLLAGELEPEARFHLVRLLGHFAGSAKVEGALVDFLEKVEASDGLMRMLLVESLARTAGPGADAALRSLLAKEADPEIREELGDLLGRRPSWNLQPNSSPS
jgi:hypothetical protein